eukprot:jgi/Astpho2/1307/Aster-x0055
MRCPPCLLQGQESAGQSTLVVKIVKIAPANTHFRSPHSTHSVSVHEPSTDCQVTFSAVYQPPNLLERPKVFHQDVLASLLAPDSAQYAVRTAHEVFTAYQQSHMSLPDIFQEHDALGLSEGMAVVRLENDYIGLLMAVDSDRDEDFLPPEGCIAPCPITPEGKHSAQRLHSCT